MRGLAELDEALPDSPDDRVRTAEPGTEGPAIGVDVGGHRGDAADVDLAQAVADAVDAPHEGPLGHDANVRLHGQRGPRRGRRTSRAAAADGDRCEEDSKT